MSTEKNNRPQNMTPEDHAALDAAGAAWNNATTQAEKDAAHKAAEEIRNKYNYSGGADGGSYVPTTGNAQQNAAPTPPSSGSYKPAGAGSDYYMNNVVTQDGSGMSSADKTALKAAGDAWNTAEANYQAAKAAGRTDLMAKYQAEKDAAHAAAEQIRNKYGYSGGADGSEFIQTGSQAVVPPAPGAGVQGGAQTGPQNGAQTGVQLTPGQVTAPDLTAPNLPGYTASTITRPNLTAPELNQFTGQTITKPDIAAPDMKDFTAEVPDFTGLLDQWLEQAKGQQQGAIDYATQQGITELERAQEDAQEQFQAQQNQIDADEAKALDNQALYAEARGDKGGIGQAQYNQIQATAMTNRRAVNSARTKLSTDTARAIADLRAKGEFEKADSLLQLTQTYLTQLIQLQQWGAEYSMNVAQFNAQLQQWQAEYNMQAQQYLSSLEQWQADHNLSVNQLNNQNKQWLADYNMNAQQFQSALEQWQAEHNLSVDQLNNQNNQWLADYNMDAQKFQTGLEQWQAEFNMDAQKWQAEYDYTVAQNEKKHLADQGMAMLSAGIRPSASQQAAMGLSNEQVDAYLALFKLETASGGSGTTANINSGKYSESTKGYDELLSDIQALRSAGENSATINNVINKALSAGTITSAQASQLRGSYVGNR